MTIKDQPEPAQETPGVVGETDQPQVAAGSDVEQQQRQQDYGRRGGRRGRVYGAPILYSPCYYWFRFILGVVFLVQNGIIFHLYEKVCPPGDSEGNMEGSIFYILMMVFWGIQAAFHLLFIVHRFMAKTPVSDVLYDGPIESKLSIFLTLDLVAVIAVGIWGIVLTAKSDYSSPCAANPNMNTQIQRVAIVNLVLAILVMLRVLRGCVQPNPA